jgi:hypothetical protein
MDARIRCGTRSWNPTPSTSLRAGPCAQNAQGWGTRLRFINFSTVADAKNQHYEPIVFERTD